MFKCSYHWDILDSHFHIERIISLRRKLIRKGQLLLLGLHAQCTVVVAVSISVSDCTLQMFCLSISQKLDYAENPGRAVYVSTANLPSMEFLGTKHQTEV